MLNYMKFFIPGIFLMLWIPACKSPKKENETPRALQNKSVDVSEYTKRVNYDLVDNLYDELEEKNPALKSLATEARLLEKLKQDSTRHYLQFVSKNMAYYAAAIRQSGSIKDSILRKQVIAIMDSSRNDFNGQLEGHQSLVKYLDSAKTLLADHLIVLKLIKTMDLMEDYQQKQMPDSAGIRILLQKYLALISVTDSLRSSKP